VSAIFGETITQRNFHTHLKLKHKFIAVHKKEVLAAVGITIEIVCC